MKKYNFYCIFCSLFLTYFYATAQNKKIVDSLYFLINKKNVADTTLIKAYNDLGVQYAISNSKEALSYTQKALAIAKRIEVSRGKAGAYNCMGIVYYYKEEYDSALVCCQKAFNINKKLNHRWGQAAALNQMGAIYNKKENITKAIQSFTKAKELFKNEGDSVSYAKSIENIGKAFFYSKNQEKGIDFFMQAIKVYEKVNNKEGISRGYVNLATMLTKQKAYKKALNYLSQAMPIIKSNGNKYLLSSTYYKIARCYKELQRIDEAEKKILEAIPLVKEIEKNDLLLYYYQSLLAEIYYEKKQYMLSLNYLKKAKKRVQGKKYRLSYINNLFAKCNLQLNKIGKAKEQAVLSLRIANELESKEGIKNANLTLALIAEKQGKNKEALVRYKKYLELKDSLESNESKAYVMKLQTMYEANKKDKQIKFQECAIETLQEKWKASSLKNNLFLVGLILSLIAVFFIVFFSKKKVKTKELEKKELVNALTTKKKELAYQSLQITKKNKLLQELKQRLENLKETREDVRNNEQVYQKLIHAINFDITDDTSWEYFKTHFEQLHHDFYKKIKKQFPNITTNELRLLAFIKLNLSSNEIATILNITKDSVKKAKYRLRKKLAIKSKEEFQELILAI